MDCMVVIHHLILPWEPIDTLAVAPRIWTIETFYASLVSSHMAIKVAVASDSCVASWVLAAVAPSGCIARIDVMSILLDWSLDLVCDMLDAWALWSSHSHVRLLREMTLGIGNWVDRVVAAGKCKS